MKPMIMCVAAGVYSPKGVPPVQHVGGGPSPQSHPLPGHLGHGAHRHHRVETHL